VLCTTVLYNDMHTDEQFLKLSVGLSLVFVCLFIFSILCFSVFFVLFAFVVLGLVFLSSMSRYWLEKNVSEMTYFVSSGMQNTRSIMKGIISVTS